MKGYIKKFIYLIFPLIELNYSEKKIKEKLKKIDDELTKEENSQKIIKEILGKYNINRLPLEEIIEFYKQPLETKKELENKAKIGIIGVTLSIGIIYTLSKNYKDLSSCSLFISLIALIYAIIGGYLALKLISDKNKVYRVSLNDVKFPYFYKKNLILAYELNNKMNIIRQNYIYASFKFIVYSALLTILAFVIDPIKYKFLKDIDISILLTKLKMLIYILVISLKEKITLIIL